MIAEIRNSYDRFINRDLSWLQFNARVLQEAKDPSVPLIERLRFLGIFSNNLDEFFKVRYATIKRIVEADNLGTSKLRGISARDLQEEITQTVITQQQLSLDILGAIQNELGKEGIHIINENQITEEQSAFITDYFLKKVSPALVTIILSDLDTFPSLKDSAAYLAVRMVLNKSKDSPEELRYALIEIPRVINRFIELPEKNGQKYIIILDDLIRHCMRIIFSIFSYNEISTYMIKITRDAELDIDSDLSRSFLDQISKSVARRSSGDPVRFVYDRNIDSEMLHFLMKKMGIESTDSVIPGGRYHNRRDYMKFPSLGRQDLLYDIKTPLLIRGLNFEGSLLAKIAKKDYLLHAPYQSFRYVVKFLREAALDPKVQSIKITIYRLAEISHIASSLINAAKNGKDVVVQIELRARFDEVANIHYAEQMQEHGVRMIYGVKGLKVHCKACVIEREESGKIKRYSFLSTGNFNETTARIYTDYTLFTANEGIAKDINKIFNFFDVNYRVKSYKHLVVSPHYTREVWETLINREIKNKCKGSSAGIQLKLNSLSDYQIIDKLYEASQNGVPIKILVRGICCLIPGIKGLSENISVISIVDKFLEHSRLYIFNNNNDPQYFISSADIMGRNLDTRVEISCPIYDSGIKQELQETFDISWQDNVKARLISKSQDNTYIKEGRGSIRSQFAIYEYYQKKLNAV